MQILSISANLPTSAEAGRAKETEEEEEGGDEVRDGQRRGGGGRNVSA